MKHMLTMIAVAAAVTLFGAREAAENALPLMAGKLRSVAGRVPEVHNAAPRPPCEDSSIFFH